MRFLFASVACCEMPMPRHTWTTKWKLLAPARRSSADRPVAPSPCKRMGVAHKVEQCQLEVHLYFSCVYCVMRILFIIILQRLEVPVEHVEHGLLAQRRGQTPQHLLHRISRLLLAASCPPGSRARVSERRDILCNRASLSGGIMRCSSAYCREEEALHCSGTQSRAGSVRGPSHRTPHSCVV